MNSNLTLLSPRIVKPSAFSASPFWSTCKVWRLFVVCKDPNTACGNSLKPFCHCESNMPVSSAAFLGNITSARINISIWELKLRKIALALHGSAYFFLSGVLHSIPLLLSLPKRLSFALTFSSGCVDHLRGWILWLNEFQLCVFKKEPLFVSLKNVNIFSGLDDIYGTPNSPFMVSTKRLRGKEIIKDLWVIKKVRSHSTSL